MREALNGCLPVIQNSLDCGFLNIGGAANTNITGNGYYGYLNHSQPAKQNLKQQKPEKMETSTCQPDIQFNNYMEVDRSAGAFLNCGQTNRKRALQTEENGAGAPKFKKFRENELTSCTFPKISRPCLKQPTHNVPDMQRCIMGHYI